MSSIQVDRLLGKPFSAYDMDQDLLAQLTEQQILTVGDYVKRVDGSSAHDLPWAGCDADVAAAIEGMLEQDGITLDVSTGKVKVEYDMELVNAAEVPAAVAAAPVVAPAPVVAAGKDYASPVSSLDLVTATIADLVLNKIRTVGDLVASLSDGRFENVLAVRATPRTTRAAVVAALAEKGIQVEEASDGVVGNVRGVGVCTEEDAPAAVSVSSDPAETAASDQRAVEQQADQSKGVLSESSAEDAVMDGSEGVCQHGNDAKSESTSEPTTSDAGVLDGSGPAVAKLADIKALAMRVAEAISATEDAKAAYKQCKKQSDRLIEQLTSNAINADQYDLLDGLHAKPEVSDRKPVALPDGFNLEAWEAALGEIDKRYAAMPITALEHWGFPAKTVQFLAEEHKVSTLGDVQVLTEKNAKYNAAWYAYLKGFGAGKAQKFDDAYDNLMRLRKAEVDALAKKFPGATEYLNGESDKEADLVDAGVEAV